ncbi:MAG TPA: hypothetical protein PLM80_11375 [Mesotoga sp.]|mgnify:FL=1|nr:hypothetical protein [Mesotoga sp.]MDI9376405.1 hypothetical protein [Thermotogota bacterium]NLX33926.1 hypothetical protein [Thermotogaceae bacterium]MDD4039552.1 hypothetical protein [Mesotoga sp.]MDD4477495.1 hypothetical protein [Mesotoga sp.]
MKRNIIRLALVIVLIVLGLCLYVLGKEHKIFVDNRDIVINGTELKSTNPFIVYVDNVDLEEVGKGKRKVAYSPGPWHTVKAIEKLPDGTTREFVKKFTLSPKDTAIINLPALVSEKDGWLKIEGE